MKRTSWSRRLIPFSAVLMGLALSACGGGSAPSRFYMLSTDPVVEADPTGAPERIVGMRTVFIAEYLKRPYMVFRTSDNRLEMMEFDRWAENLEDNVGEVLQTRIQGRLGSSAKVVHPWRGRTKPEIDLSVSVDRLDRTVDGPARIVAEWAIWRHEEEQPLATAVFRDSEPVTEGEDDKDQTPTAAAMSRLIERLADEIAAAIAEH